MELQHQPDCNAGVQWVRETYQATAWTPQRAFLGGRRGDDHGQLLPLRSVIPVEPHRGGRRVVAGGVGGRAMPIR